MNKRWFIIIITVLLLFGIASSYFSIKRYNNSFFEKNIKNSFIPANSVMHKIAKYISGYIVDIINVKKIKNENVKLKEQLKKINSEKLVIDDIKSENQTLKKLLDLKEKQSNNAELILAEVIMRSPITWYSSFILDKGTKDGITPNMVVVTSEGLVGIIVEVGHNWSKVQTLLDSTFAASSMILRTRDIGILKGREELISKNLAELFYISKDSDVGVNDVVITSGMGDVLPKGILIGKVFSVSTDEQDLTKKIYVKPMVDFDNIEYVFIVKRVKSINFSVGVN